MVDTNQNFQMMAGDDLLLNYTVSSDVALTLAGATVRWWAARKARRAFAQAEIQKSTGGNGITVTNETERLFTVTLDAADTDQLQGDYYHECEIIDAAGKVSTVAVGRMTIQLTLVR